MRAPSNKLRAQEYILSQGWLAIGEAEWRRIRAEFPDVPESSLRSWLHETGTSVAQPYAGIWTKSIEELESSLLAMTDAYLQTPDHRKACRAQVIAAKDRARYASANTKASPEKRALKLEMVEWMLVWLGDPAMFGTWAKLRKRSICANPLP